MSTPPSNDNVKMRIAAWLVFGVVFGLLPLILDAFREHLVDGEVVASRVLGDGALFVTGAVLAAAVIGEAAFAAAAGHLTLEGATSRVCFIALFGGILMAFGINAAGYVAVKSDRESVPVAHESPMRSEQPTSEPTPANEDEKREPAPAEAVGTVRVSDAADAGLCAALVAFIFTVASSVVVIGMVTPQ